MLPDDEDRRRRAPPPTPQSGYQQLMGYRLVEWREGLAIAELAVGPQHLNISGVLHGGVLMSLLDTVCGYAGCFSAEPGPTRRAPGAARRRPRVVGWPRFRYRHPRCCTGLA